MTNIAELLKNCPKGIKLYSPLLGEVEFAEVMDTDYVPIRVMCGTTGERFDEFGRYKGNEYPDAECLLFPSKDCRTWEGWKVPVEPKFKAEDRIVSKSDKSTIYRIITLHEERREYIVEIEHKDYHESCPWIAFEDQDDYELVPKPHYDIANFKPFDKVLIRDRDESKWGNTYFGFYDEDQKVFVCDCYEWEQCIPFNEETKHLLGTTNPCDERFINW